MPTSSFPDAKAANTWRKSVDRKLAMLAVNYKDLNDRLDTYVKDMQKNTDLTRGIDKKIDDLIVRTAIAVEIAQRAKWTAMAGRLMWKWTTRIAVALGQYGVAVLVILTGWYVWHQHENWGAAFIRIFNGNL